jgi:hypothetical protein
MKIIATFFLAFVITSQSVNAQTGSWYVGGNVGFSTRHSEIEAGSNSTNNGKTTSWTFSPEFGTFLTDHVQLGLAVTVGGSKFDNQGTPNPTITKSNNYGGTLYSRYFFGKNAFKPFVGINVAALPGKSTTTSGNLSSEAKTFQFQSNVNAGFGYALSKKVTAVGSFGFLGFESSTSKSGNTKIKNSSFGLDAGSLGNRFNVGFYYTL